MRDPWRKGRWPIENFLEDLADSLIEEEHAAHQADFFASVTDEADYGDGDDEMGINI